MKNHISKVMVLSLFTAGLLAVPVLAHAQDANVKNAPASSDQTTNPKPAKHGSIPFHGKIGAVDTSAMTLKVGARTFEITADTKIFNNGEPAALSDGKVGEPVRGTYKKTEAGKLEAVTVHFGAKTEEKPKPENSNEN
ncbi:MAG TPA: hypothetical protein VG077_05000 [Verrucomicrobiae bacterium]|nr:hypothetical protein [Verrucomicrobiae bacterium]